MNWNDHIIYAMKILPEDTGYCFYFPALRYTNVTMRS